jgi:hypothetical protein
MRTELSVLELRHPRGQLGELRVCLLLVVLSEHISGFPPFSVSLTWPNVSTTWLSVLPRKPPSETGVTGTRTVVPPINSNSFQRRQSSREGHSLTGGPDGVTFLR